MTSKFRLRDLPEELFDNVIAHYVHSVPVNDASATRAVSSKLITRNTIIVC